MNKVLRMLAKLEPWSRKVEIAVIQERGSNFLCALPVAMEPRELETCVTPMLTLEPLAVQELMDDLWRCGYRPSEGTGSAGQLAATERHLEDMRKLVFDKS